jgi:hypothetical protein
MMNNDDWSTKKFKGHQKNEQKIKTRTTNLSLFSKLVEDNLMWQGVESVYNVYLKHHPIMMNIRSGPIPWTTTSQLPLMITSNSYGDNWKANSSRNYMHKALFRKIWSKWITFLLVSVEVKWKCWGNGGRLGGLIMSN